MIARLHGKVVALGPDSLVVEVQGVGYRVRVPRSLRQELESPGAMITLHTHLHVRENELALYGCASEDELALFELLLGVQGVGPRLAMNIVSGVAAETLREAIARGDALSLTRIPGVGKRTAERLVTELKDRFAGPQAPSLAGLSAGDAEVVAALTALGYSVAEAHQALRSLPAADDLPLEERVRLALRSFARE